MQFSAFGREFGCEFVCFARRIPATRQARHEREKREREAMFAREFMPEQGKLEALEEWVLPGDDQRFRRVI